MSISTLAETWLDREFCKACSRAIGITEYRIARTVNLVSSRLLQIHTLSFSQLEDPVVSQAIKRLRDRPGSDYRKDVNAEDFVRLMETGGVMINHRYRRLFNEVAPKILVFLKENFD